MTADPVAKALGGSAPDAVDITVGSVNPTPTPVRIIPPSTPCT